MKELIEKVRQWGLDRNIVYTGAEGQDKQKMMEVQARYTLKETAELLDAYADQDIEKINDAIGDILVTLIVGASNDEDIYDSVKDWFCEQHFDRYGYDELARFSALYINLIHCGFCILNTRHQSDAMYCHFILELDNVLETINWNMNQKLSLKDCLELAYNEIKDRKGKVVNGQFIKEQL